MQPVAKALHAGDERRYILRATGAARRRDEACRLIGKLGVVGQQNADRVFEQLRQQGVVGVFNLRTDTEMADRAQVPYDEATLAQELGYDYVQEPVGGSDHPFRPEVLAAFKAQLDRSEGKILLHCATGGRAGLLYAAYAVKYLGQEPDAAMRSLEALGGWPLPLERLTGIPLKVERREAEAAPR